MTSEINFFLRVQGLWEGVIGIPPPPDPPFELAVRDFVADGGGDPTADMADAALVAGGADVARLAGEGEELFVATLGAMEAGEAGSEITATAERSTVGEVFSLGCLMPASDRVGSRFRENPNFPCYASHVFSVCRRSGL